MTTRACPGPPEISLKELPEWSRLDTAAYRVSIKRSVRRFGWIGALAGAVIVGCGLAAHFAAFVVLGAVLLGAGLWNVSRPAASGLLVDGVVMILTGIFNCTALLWIEARSALLGKCILAGALQVWWGVQRLRFYWSARFARNDRQAIARLETLVRELSRRDAKTDATVAVLRTGRFGLRRDRLGFYAEGAIALLEHWVVRLEKRSDVWIDVQGTTSLGRTLKVLVHLGDVQVAGQMSLSHFERFERWKLGQEHARSAVA